MPKPTGKRRKQYQDNIAKVRAAKAQKRKDKEDGKLPPVQAPASAFEQLNPRQQKFVYHYVMSGNGAQSVRKVGYKGSDVGKKVYAYHLLRDPKVKAAIKESLSTAAATADEVLARLKEHAFGNIMDFVDKRGRVISFAELKAKGFLVKSYKINETGAAEIEFHGPNKALELLAKHHGLLTEKVEVSGPEGGPVQVSNLTSDTDVLDSCAPKPKQE